MLSSAQEPMEQVIQIRCLGVAPRQSMAT